MSGPAVSVTQAGKARLRFLPVSSLATPTSSKRHPGRGCRERQRGPASDVLERDHETLFENIVHPQRRSCRTSSLLNPDPILLELVGKPPCGRDGAFR